ncbi:hypothetical protein DERP_012998 [Dermatophagoides pteronyssinus]|uniref:Uncharacterized protein n=1 Tax=Dermatophagoides pteronyssinus TaxID=6956 RepID=A0ABQ8ISI8_DERPT|nr:hypothetical protein DERP_012998 [Dermatophagoides pteronyssinus]
MITFIKPKKSYTTNEENQKNSNIWSFDETNISKSHSKYVHRYVVDRIGSDLIESVNQTHI